MFCIDLIHCIFHNESEAKSTLIYTVGPQAERNNGEASLVRLRIHNGAESQITGHYFPPSSIFHNPLPFTADVVRLPPLAEVAGELVNGKEPSERNIPRQIEEIGGNIVEPSRCTRTAAQSEWPAQNQQNDRYSHDADKPEIDARVMRTVCVCASASGNIVICKLT